MLSPHKKKKKIYFLFENSVWLAASYMAPTCSLPFLHLEIWKDVPQPHIDTCFWGCQSSCLIPGSKRAKSENVEEKEEYWPRNAVEGTALILSQQDVRAEPNLESQTSADSLFSEWQRSHLRTRKWESRRILFKTVRRNHSFSWFLRDFNKPVAREQFKQQSTPPVSSKHLTELITPTPKVNEWQWCTLQTSFKPREENSVSK